MLRRLIGRKKKAGVPIYLNVYDLTPMNGYLYWFGIGIYHSAVEGKSHIFLLYDSTRSLIFCDFMLYFLIIFSRMLIFSIFLGFFLLHCVFSMTTNFLYCVFWRYLLAFPYFLSSFYVCIFWRYILAFSAFRFLLTLCFFPYQCVLFYIFFVFFWNFLIYFCFSFFVYLSRILVDYGRFPVCKRFACMLISLEGQRYSTTI